MTWTDARITELTELWECNCPTGEIARIMGLTKNAIIGKAHRLELPPRESPIIRTAPGTVSEKPSRKPTWTTERNARLTEMHNAGASSDAVAKELGLGKRSVIGQLSRLGLTRQPSRKPHSKPAPAPATTPREPQEAISLSRFHTCQFIEGDPTADDSCKCGEPCRVGSSYCPPHDAICWQSVKPGKAA